MKINQILQYENIILDVEAETKQFIIEQLTELLYKSGRITEKESFLREVKSRELLGFTGIGKGIAIPHGISDTVKKVSVAIARTTNNVLWNASGDIKEADRCVRLIILFAVPSEDVYKVEREHIEALKLIMEKLSDQKTLHRLLKAGNKQEIINIFEEELL